MAGKPMPKVQPPHVGAEPPRDGGRKLKLKLFHVGSLGCPHPTTRHGGLGAAVLVVLAAGDKTGKKCPAHLPLRGRLAC